MTVRIDRLVAPAAVRPSARHNPIGVVAEGGGLPAGDLHTDALVVVVDRITLLVDLVHLLELQHDHVRPRVVAESDRTEHELLRRGRQQLKRASQRSVLGRGEILKHVAQMVDHGGDLLLLALHRELRVTRAQLQEEHARTRPTDRPGGEHIHWIEGIELAHASSPIGPPVVLTASTTGPPSNQERAEIEQVDTTMRWKRSM